MFMWPQLQHYQVTPGKGYSLCIIMFGLSVIWGGIWCNQFKEEYLNHESNIANFAKVQRGLQFIGGAVFVFEGGFSLFLRNDTFIHWYLVLIFFLTFLIWQLFYSMYTVHKCGDSASEFCVNIIVPDSLILSGYESDHLNIKKDEILS